MRIETVSSTVSGVRIRTPGADPGSPLTVSPVITLSDDLRSSFETDPEHAESAVARTKQSATGAGRQLADLVAAQVV